MNLRYERYVSGGCYYIGHIIKPGRRIAVFDRALRRRQIVRVLADRGMTSRQIARALGMKQAASALFCANSWIKTKNNLHKLENFHKPKGRARDI
jgi:hypothetical protein